MEDIKEKDIICQDRKEIAKNPITKNSNRSCQIMKKIDRILLKWTQIIHHLSVSRIYICLVESLGKVIAKPVLGKCALIEYE